jgi:curved DNA-binding protein CbpA
MAEHAMATLYDKLGVQPHASDDEIKRAYRKAAMRWHPDRNAGREADAQAAFQEIRDAYGILSDPAQRRVYDEVFAEHMRAWEAQQAQHAREQAEREAAQRAAAEQAYTRRVALAMRFVGQGYNRDVVWGVLLGDGCEPALAAQIADSTQALHASRQAEPAEPVAPSSGAPAPSPVHDAGDAHTSTPPGDGTPGGLWFQFLNSLRL